MASSVIREESGASLVPAAQQRLCANSGRCWAALGDAHKRTRKRDRCRRDRSGPTRQDRRMSACIALRIVWYRVLAGPRSHTRGHVFGKGPLAW